LFFLCAIFAVALLGTAFDKNDKAKDSAEASGRVVGILLVMALPGSFGYRYARNAARATRAGALAKSDPSFTFRISGKYIITADSGGAPRPNLSFKINQKQRTMLLAVPRAEVVDHKRS